MKNLTVKQLIDILQKVENKNQEVQIDLRQYNKLPQMPVASMPIKAPAYDKFIETITDKVIISVSLPSSEESFMFVSTKKLK